MINTKYIDSPSGKRGVGFTGIDSINKPVAIERGPDGLPKNKLSTKQVGFRDSWQDHVHGTGIEEQDVTIGWILNPFHPNYIEAGAQRAKYPNFFQRVGLWLSYKLLNLFSGRG